MTNSRKAAPLRALRGLWTAGRMRWRRRRFLFRAARKRRQLSVAQDRTGRIRPGDILCFATIRNEATRLPFFLRHYRGMGVSHFLIVDNGSDDGSDELLREQPDVSLWRTRHSYRLSRFGIDWLTWLQMRHGHGHWCLTVDADELFVFPHHDSRSLRELTGWLDAHGIASFGALMLELYPRGALAQRQYRAGQNPAEILHWFDADGYRTRYQRDLRNWLIRGGVRERMFFAADPQRAPTLSKIPLVKWHWRYAYASSTHSILPRRLNTVRTEHAGTHPTGILLHTKFLHLIVARAREEKARRQHFANSRLYDDYYDALIANPGFWHHGAVRFRDWRQLESLGLMSRGTWSQDQGRRESEP